MNSPLSITYQGSASTFQILSDRIANGLRKPTDWERSFGRRCANMQLHVNFVSFEESLNAAKAERIVASPTPLATGFGSLPPDAATHPVPARTSPVVLHLYFSDCQTAEGYKASRVREQITVWLSEIRSHHPCPEWAVVVLANTDAASSARLIGGGSSRLYKSAHGSASVTGGVGQSGTSAASGKFEVADRIRADFCSRSLSDKHRCLVFRSPKSKHFQQDEFWWSSISELRSIIFDIVERKLRMHEENVRRLREDRQQNSFNILQCFCAQSYLASEYQQLGLLEDSLLQLDEMDAMLTLFIEESHQRSTTDVLRRPCRDFNSPNLTLFQHSPASTSGAQVVHRKVRDYVYAAQDVLAFVAANAADHTVLDQYDINIVRLRNHLFVCQCYSLIQLQRGWEIPLRAVAVIHCLLHELSTLLSTKTLPTSADDGAVQTKEKYLNALNAWSFLLALQCIDVANDQARSRALSAQTSNSRSEISFNTDDGSSVPSSTGTSVNSVRVQQANATLLDIARLKLRELGIQQRIAPVFSAFDFGDESEKNNTVKHAGSTTSIATISNFESILPSTFPHEGRQRLLRALASAPAFTSYYLEFSEFVLGTCKHVGRIRGARLIGKELAAYYVTANEPEKATAFLRDAIKSYRYEGWSQLAVSSMSLYADCCCRSGNFERAVKDALLVACSSGSHHSLETRKRFMQLAFYSANQQLLQQQQAQEKDSVFEKKSPTSPPSLPSGPKTIKTTQIFSVQSASRCNGDYPLFVSNLPTSFYADDITHSNSEIASESFSATNSPNASPEKLPKTEAPSCSRLMLKVIVRSALPDLVTVDRKSVKCLMWHRPLGFRHNRSVSMAASDLMQQKSLSGDSAQHRQIPLHSSSSSHHVGSHDGSSLPRHYSAMNIAQLAKQQNVEQQEVSSRPAAPAVRPDFLSEFAVGARRPLSAHVGVPKSATAADDDDSAVLAALSSSNTAQPTTARKHGSLQRLMTRASVSGPDHFLALKQEQSGMTSNKSLNAQNLRRKQSGFSRMTSVAAGGGSSVGGKFMNVKRVVTYGTSTTAKLPTSSSVSGPFSSTREADVRSEHTAAITAATVSTVGPSSAKSTPTHRGLAASALRKSANKASKLFSSSTSSSALATSVAGDSVNDDGTGRNNNDMDGTESDPLFTVASNSAPSDSLLGGENIPSFLSHSADAAVTAEENEDAVSISRVSVASLGSSAKANNNTGALALAPVGRDSFRSRATVTSAGLVCIPYESLTAAVLNSPETHGSGAWRAVDSNATSPTHDLCVDALSLTPSRTESLPQGSMVLERGNSIFSGNEVNPGDDDDAETTPSENEGDDEVDSIAVQTRKNSQRNSGRRTKAKFDTTARHRSIADSSQVVSLHAYSDDAAVEQHFVVLKISVANSGTDAHQLTLKPGLNSLIFEGQLDEPGIYEPFALFIELVPGVLNNFSPIYADEASTPDAASPLKTSSRDKLSTKICVDNKPPQMSILTDSGELYDSVPQTFSLKLFLSSHCLPTASSRRGGSGGAIGNDLDVNVRLICRSIDSTNATAGGNLPYEAELPNPVFLPKSYKERLNSCWAVDSLLVGGDDDADSTVKLNRKTVTLRADQNFESDPIEALIPAYPITDMELLVVVDYPWKNRDNTSADETIQLRERSATEATLVEGGGGDADKIITVNTDADVDAAIDRTDLVRSYQFVLTRHKVRNTFNIETKQIATCKPDEHMLQVILTCRYAARFLLHNPMLELLSARSANSVQIIGDAMGVQNFRNGWMPFKQGSRAVFTWRLAFIPHEKNTHSRKENNSCEFLFSMEYGVDERLYGADAINKTTDINAFVSHLMACKQDSSGHVNVSGRQSGAASRNSVDISNDNVPNKNKNSAPFSMPFCLRYVISANVQSRLVNVRICLRDQNKPLCRLGEQFFVKYRISIAFGIAVKKGVAVADEGSNETGDSVHDLPLDLYYRVRLPPNQDSPDWRVLSGETGSLSLNASVRAAADVAESGDNATRSISVKADAESNPQLELVGEGDAASQRVAPRADGNTQTIQPILQPLRSGILQLPKLQLFMYRNDGLEELTSTSVYYENPCVLITVFVEEMPNNANDVLVSDSDEVEVR